jgi:hypothetical protein
MGKCRFFGAIFTTSIIFFFGDEELGWMDDEMDDGTDGWKGRPPRILYK